MLAGLAQGTGRGCRVTLALNPAEPRKTRFSDESGSHDERTQIDTRKWLCHSGDLPDSWITIAWNAV
jgi:hypothetical protein